MLQPAVTNGETEETIIFSYLKEDGVAESWSGEQMASPSV